MIPKEMALLLKKFVLGAGAVAQLVRALPVLLEDLSSVPSPHSGQLTTTYITPWLGL